MRAIRLSVLTDSTTSVERQREAGNRSAAALDIDFGEGDGLREAVDLDVSALKLSPFERPQLGPWLARPDEYDAVVWWRFDRAIASMSDMHDLSKWAKEHRKMLVFDEGVGNAGRLVFDFRNPMDPMAELMMMLFAFAAQVERLSTKERVTGAHAALRNMSLRWKGGRPPYGYEPKRLEGGGWTLKPDPDAVKVIQRIIWELKGDDSDTGRGKSPTAIAVELTEEGVPAPWRYWQEKRQALRAAQAADSDESTSGGDAGSEDEDGEEGYCARGWAGSTIKSMLTDHAMLGWKTYKGQVVREPKSGAPVAFTDEPILSRAEFDHIGEIFAARARKPHERRGTNSLLLGVLICDGCGSRMYLQRRAKAQNYVCKHYNTRVGRCPAPSSIKQAWAEEYAEREFLRRLGSVRVLEHETIPGYDPGPEIEETEAEFKAHLAERGEQKSRAAVAAWQERHDALDARLAELEARPKTEPQVIVKAQSATYAQMWEAGDVHERRDLLLGCEVVVTVKRGKPAGWRRLDESRVSFEIKAELFADAADELRDCPATARWLG
ncbi:recombinase family protein [Streptomyces sp. PSKA54]|uniref:Recombinase family protein n=1 Tax=Streptomyces himalayensis subsp. aureolus TaxID=2758039 RepID=A0A7W2D5E2_9ACTN|nr:recombinase family protein [Streptomyces himalayensis subsp. aureolus]